MKVTFLGTAGSYISKTRTYPSILINNNLLLDCGEGTTQKLIILEAINTIKTICITHLHNDHFMGIFSLLWYYWINQRKESITILGPSPIESTINSILKLANTPEDMKSCDIKFIEINDSHIIGSQKSEYKIEWSKMNHKTLSYAYKIEKNKKSVCYTGDMKPNANITKLANNCDLLICESTFPDKMVSVAHNLYHSTPSDAAEIASNADVKKLALIHISPTFSKQVQRFKKQAEKIFKGKVKIPNDLESINI